MIYEILSPRHYQFVIPAYQRPYAWSKEQAKALAEDLLDAFEELPDHEYFLGSIVVVKRSSSSVEAEVVDGQQRLTSLSIFVAALRDLMPIEERPGISGLLVSEGLRLRTTGRESDNNFFSEYIRKEEGFCMLAAMQTVLPSSQECMRRNALEMRSVLVERTGCEIDGNPKILKQVLNFVLQKGCLVVVESTDFDSAYRIFSTMNNRGLPLGVPDLIKALILEQFKDDQERDDINKIWEQEEADLTRIASSGSEDATESRRYFELLFSHIHRMATKRRSAKSLFEDFRQDVLGSNEKDGSIGHVKAKSFVEDLLVKSADAYEIILKKAVQTPDVNIKSKINNLYLPLLENINNSDWQPVAISFLSRYRYLMAEAHVFFRLLERTAAVSTILGENVNKRARRYAPILHALELGQQQAFAALETSVADEEKEKVLKLIDDNIYGEPYAFYVMLRLDSALAEGGISPSLSAPRASIEHVAPQTLKEAWMMSWNDAKHQELVNRLGNLVLLSKRKNSRAQNFDFKTKKEVYFSGGSKSIGDGSGDTRTVRTGDVAIFPSVTRVLKVGGDWTPRVVRNNQIQFVSLLKSVWCL